MKASLWLWLSQNNYSGIGFEIDLPGNAGRADVVALDTSNRITMLIEIKASRADFRRGIAKLSPEVYWDKANICYVAAPAGVVPLDEVPEGWGLLEMTDEAGVVNIIRPAMLHTCPAPFYDRFVKLLLERCRDRMYETRAVLRHFKRVKGRPE